MKAIHNDCFSIDILKNVVLYPKDTEKWKQFTTLVKSFQVLTKLFCIPKILKNESNSQRGITSCINYECCFVSQRYWKMKAIHNNLTTYHIWTTVVLYPKDTEKWKQFTTLNLTYLREYLLFCIPKILKNESNSQQTIVTPQNARCCFVSQRYWKMKAIHNYRGRKTGTRKVVLYPKDTEKWKQFTTHKFHSTNF